MTLDLDLIRRREEARRTLNRITASTTSGTRDWAKWNAEHGDASSHVRAHAAWWHGDKQGRSPVSRMGQRSWLSYHNDAGDKAARKGDHAAAAAHYQAAADAAKGAIADREKFGYDYGEAKEGERVGPVAQAAADFHRDMAAKEAESRPKA